jgi:predicted branched-subunit amino acid permease
MPESTSDTQAAPSDSPSRWFLRGARAVVSIPALVLLTAMIGFAGLAKEAGFTLAQTLFMTVFIWALPAKVVLIGAVLSGASLFGAGLAVTLSSIRLLPMVVALMPEMRGPGTRRWVLYFLSHFVAVTSWVMALQLLRSVPRDMRTSFYAGIVIPLMLAGLAVVTVVYLIAESLSPTVSAALLFLTPMYFLTSLWGSARERAGHVAMVAGMVIGPVFHAFAPRFDLVAAGVIGGGLAYAFHRLTAKRAA